MPLPNGTVGVMTHFWITGMEQTVHQPGSFFSSDGTDNTTVCYYVDGEAEHSIQAANSTPMAAGVGFSDADANGGPPGWRTG